MAYNPQDLAFFRFFLGDTTLLLHGSERRLVALWNGKKSSSKPPCLGSMLTFGGCNFGEVHIMAQRLNVMVYLPTFNHNN